MTIPYGEDNAGAESVHHAHETFRLWLGPSYDMAVLDAVLCCAAAEQLSGDPPWLLVVGGPGNAKTETVAALAGVGAHITSTIGSEGALLSATGYKERSKDATGGLLRKVGPRGLIVVKDFTTILSMNRDMRAQVLAALREVYDGRWERNVGTDGGRTLTWVGRIVLIGAVTTAYDTHHAVVASMGDRFALARLDSTEGRLDAGRQALANVGSEDEMRQALAEAARAVLRGVRKDRARLDESTQHDLLRLADVVTWARTAVERDHKGDVVDAHAPEMPTRFAKMLGQIVRGGLAVGMERDRALKTAIRVAGDSMPPLRLAVLADVMGNPQTVTSDVRTRLQKPYSTVDRELQALHVLGLIEQHQNEGNRWRYELSDKIDAAALTRLVTRKVSTPQQETTVDRASHAHTY